MKTQNIKEVPRNPFVLSNKKRATTATFFFKEGGIEYQIEQLEDLSITIRNPHTGESRIESMRALNAGRNKNSYYFETNLE